MAGSVNKVILIGNLGRDPEVRHTNDGKPIVNFSIATSETWRDRSSGERRERTEWHRVVVFNEKLGEIAQKYLQKGSKVYIEGALRTRKWTDQSGVEKYSTEVVLENFRGELTMLDTRGGGGGGGDFGGGDGGDYGGGGSGGSSGGMGGGGSAGISTTKFRSDARSSDPGVFAPGVCPTRPRRLNRRRVGGPGNAFLPTGRLRISAAYAIGPSRSFGRGRLAATGNNFKLNFNNLRKFSTGGDRAVRLVRIVPIWYSQVPLLRAISAFAKAR